MKKFLAAMALSCTFYGWADTIQVAQVHYVGPILVPAPIGNTDTDAQRAAKALELYLKPSADRSQIIELSESLPGCDQGVALHQLSFQLENRDFDKASILVEGIEQYELSIDGQAAVGSVELKPATHDVAVKYVSVPDSTYSASISIISEGGKALSLPLDGKHIITLDDIIYNKRVAGASISPSGAYILAAFSSVSKGAPTRYSYALYDTKTGKQIRTVAANYRWMPHSDKLLVEYRDQQHGRYLVAMNPLDGTEVLIADNLPDGMYNMSPTEDFLVFALTKDGKKESQLAYQITEPDDRQPGFRDKSYPAILRLDGSNALIPLTDGSENVYVADISPDGKKLLMMSSHSRLQQRPTTVSSVMIMDLNTMAIDTLVREDGFLGQATFSPKGDKVLLTGTPEAFDRIGCQLPADKYPNMTEQELFVLDLATGKVDPITKDFDPSIQDSQWSRVDGKIYVRVEDRDAYAMYRIDPANGKYQRLDLPENMVWGFDLAFDKPIAAYWAQSDSNPDRLYMLNTANNSSQMLEMPQQEKMQQLKIAQCQDWNFQNSRGDTIYGRFYLPDDFDPAKKYPLIVNYYGGCSPTSRYFESRYPHHVYAQQGYVVYVLQPSGATGFGQEFASRHVNTAGQGVAQDIIEGVQQFVAEHPYVDADKIGCIGASYGGFMTQYLQTVTDMFACAISHAGISDHTSYWGEGYWGYSYSEVSMAGSYPWSDTELYVKQSPLYNADKVNTPLLFLHGDADTNVPVGESIQMFTALKLLGKETAFVAVPGQDHHINDYDKRQRWQDTIFAWFAKYLKDDPAWWQSMYQ